MRYMNILIQKKKNVLDVRIAFLEGKES